MPDSPSLFPEFILVNRIPVRLTILTISRDVLIVLIALVLNLVSEQRRFPPTLLSKINTAVQVVTVLAVLTFNTLTLASELFLPICYWATLLTTVVSGFHYIYLTARNMTAEGPACIPADPPSRPAA